MTQTITDITCTIDAPTSGAEAGLLALLIVAFTVVILYLIRRT